MIYESKEKMNYHEHDDADMKYYPEMPNVAASMETTGMMPTPPQNREELRSYQDLAGMAIPKISPGKTINPHARHASESKAYPASPGKI